MKPNLFDVDANSIEKLKNTFRNEAGPGAKMQVDLSGINTISLPKFNMLVKFHMEARREGKSVSFINCSQPKLLDLIAKTGFRHVFQS